VVLYAYQD